jgi:hypothetical protein
MCIVIIHPPLPWAAAATLSDGDVDALVNLPDDHIQDIAIRVLGGEKNRWLHQPITFTKAALLSLGSPQQRDALLSALAHFKISVQVDTEGGGEAMQCHQRQEGREEKEPEEREDDQRGARAEDKHEEEEETGAEDGGPMRRRGQVAGEREEGLVEGSFSGSARQGFRACGCFPDRSERMWESDYIADILFGPGKDGTVPARRTHAVLPGDAENGHHPDCPEMCDEQSNVLVASLHWGNPHEKQLSRDCPRSHLPYWHRQIDLLGAPLVLFHTSDQECMCGADFLREVYARFRLVVRQHACRESLQEFYGEAGINVLVMPLGYGANYTGGQPAMQVIDAISKSRGHHRPYKWSFQGTLKWDRGLGLEVFSGMVPNFPGVPQKVGKWQLFSMHHESTFVLSGRGNHQADCFRIYEAAIAGLA